MLQDWEHWWDDGQHHRLKALQTRKVRTRQRRMYMYVSILPGAGSSFVKKKKFRDPFHSVLEIPQLFKGSKTV